MKRLEPINTEIIIESMKSENQWWFSGNIDKYYSSMNNRLYLNSFLNLIKDIEIKRAVVLMGPRRVGKSVLMQHSISKLIESGVNPRKLLLINIDNPLYINKGLEELFKIAIKATGLESYEGSYIFFDEIQYLPNWEVHLKVLVDKYHYTKFVVSGSAAAALNYKSKESGAGRFTEFLLPPLTFYEYINLKNLDYLIKPSKLSWSGLDYNFFTTIDIKQLNKNFIDYINYGGYPEIIFSEKMQSNPALFIKSDIIDKVLLRDLPSLYGINDVHELNAFFATLAYYTGSEVSLDSLSKSSGVGKLTLKKYIEYLEAAYLIKVIHRIDDSAKHFQRLNFFKVYLTNPSIRSALFSPIDNLDEQIGNMVENAIFSQRLQRESQIPRYARWSKGNSNGEVDMVGIKESNLVPIWAVELKWSNRYYEKPKELKSLVYFCEKNNIKNPIVTTIDVEGKKAIDNIEITYIPASIFAYTLGYYTISQLV